MGIFQARILEWVAMFYSRDPEWLPDASYYTTVGGRGFHGGSASKESACNMGDRGLSSGLGRSPGKGKGYPLQDSGLENSMDCIVHGVAKSQAQLNDWALSLRICWPLLLSKSSNFGSWALVNIIGVLGESHSQEWVWMVEWMVVRKTEISSLVHWSTSLCLSSHLSVSFCSFSLFTFLVHSSCFL